MNFLCDKRNLPMLLLLLAALAIGAATVADYGESWDEASIYEYADYTQAAYRALLRGGHAEPPEEILVQTGPGYAMLTGIVGRALIRIEPSWSLTTARHFVYFLTFLAGALALFRLARRWMSAEAAFGATLLFMGQPLFWGHAFVNPKDIPFLALLTVSISTGLKVVDDLAAHPRIGANITLPAVLLGLTASLRVVGPLAGLIVCAYAFRRLPWKAAAVLAGAMLLAAMLITYASWPYLWPAPLERYTESIRSSSSFRWAGETLFNGKLYRSTELPLMYFPTLVGIQLTEPALILGTIGLVIAAVWSIKARGAGPFVLIAAWFLIPLALAVSMRSQLYDNGRQLYFLLPPLFVASGLTFERLLSAARFPAFKALIILAAVLPGIVAGIRLHPYEYIYYNGLAAGTGGAYGRYEMDYWGTSFQEVGDFINSVPSHPTRVLVYGPTHLLTQQLGRVVDADNPRQSDPTEYEYVAILVREHWDGQLCASAPTLHTIQRMGAVFAFVRGPWHGGRCS